MATVDPTSTYIAWWGACLSTVLAGVKLWELWRDRFQLDVSFNFRSVPELGNDIFIRNLSGRPLILTFWEVVYCSGRWPRRTFDPLEFADPNNGDCKVDPHGTHTLHFADANYFHWGHIALNGRSIFVRLHVAGRRPILRKVYPQ